MVSRIDLVLVPRPIKIEDERPTRVINDNFRHIVDSINRAIVGGTLIPNDSITVDMLAPEAKIYSGDLSGTHPEATVVGIHGNAVATPGAGDDGQFLRYNHGSSTFSLEPVSVSNTLLDGSVHTDTVATAVAKGKLIVGNATPAWDGLPVGTDGFLLVADSSVPLGVKWATPAAAGSNALLDGSAHSDTIAQAVLKGALVVGNATPKWDRLGVGTDGQVLTADSAQTLGVKWAGGGTSNPLLDGSNHTDTAAGTVVRGDIIIGNATPKWERLARGTRRFLVSNDGADVVWDDPKRFVFARYYAHQMVRSRPYNVDIGYGAAMTIVGTPGSPADAERACTSATNNFTTPVGWAMTTGTPIVQSRHRPYARFDYRVVDGVDGCLWAGMFSSATIPTAAALGFAGVGFRWRNGTDTNIQAVTHDGTTQNTQDTGVPMDGNWHDYEILTDDAGVSWDFYIDGVLVASSSTNVPAVTTALNYMAHLTAITSTIREVRFSYTSMLLNERPSV